MDVWDNDYLNLIEPAYIPFEGANDGSFVFGTGIFGRPRLWPYTLVRVVSIGSMLVVGSNLQVVTGGI